MDLKTASANSITGVIVTVLGLFLALFVGRAVGTENYLPIILVFGFLFGMLIVFTLGDRYWYILPFAMVAQLPALPLAGRNIELSELVIAGCFCVFVARIALKKERVTLFRPTHVTVLLFMLWVALVFVTNPSGLSIMGAQSAGARFYLKLILALFSFVILASRPISEKDCKWLIGIILVGSVTNMAYSILQFFMGGQVSVVTLNMGDGLATDDFYSWHQQLSVPAISVAFLIFARYKPSEVIGFQKPLILLIYIGTIILALLSGKRMGLVAVLVAPVISAIVYRQFSYIFIGLIVSFLLGLLVVTGHGHLFTLPVTAQRAISWLPGEWDSSLKNMEGGSDDFRTELRRIAKQRIEDHPIIGQGFTVDIAETAMAINAAQYGGGIEQQAAPYALGRSWHNTWLGYAADFGIPLSILQAALWITVLVVAFRTAGWLKHPSAKQTVVIYILIFTARDVFASQTSGHSAMDAFTRWWMYGALFSLHADAFKSRFGTKISIPKLEAEKNSPPKMLPGSLGR